MVSGQDVHITQIQSGQQEIWLERMNRLVQNSNLPTKTDISGSNSPPLAPISIITLKKMALAHHSEDPQTIPGLESERMLEMRLLLGKPRRTNEAASFKQEANPIPFMAKIMT